MVLSGPTNIIIWIMCNFLHLCGDYIAKTIFVLYISMVLCEYYLQKFSCTKYNILLRCLNKGIFIEEALLNNDAPFPFFFNIFRFWTCIGIKLLMFGHSVISFKPFRPRMGYQCPNNNQHYHLYQMSDRTKWTGQKC